MKNITTLAILCVASWSMIAVWPTSSCADDSIADLTTNANAAIRASDYATGIRLLEQAISQDDDNPSLSYNLAIARYRQGDVEIARQLFTEVAAAEDPALAAKARYNLGNADFAEAIQKLEQDQAVARKQLESAIENYRQALQIDRTDSDARANIELANRLIDQLQDEQKQDQSKEDQSKEDQSKDDQSKDDQSKDDQSKDDQSKDDQSKDDQSKQDQSKEDQSKEDQSKEDQSKQDQSKQQESGQQKSSDQPSDKSQEPKQTPDPNQKQDPSNQAADSSSKSDSTESNSLNQRPDPTSAAESKAEDATSKENGTPPPEGELSPLNEQSPPTMEPATPAGEMLRDDQTMTQQEAQKMLQAVRDRELRRRLQQLQQSQSRRLRVEKDW